MLNINAFGQRFSELTMDWDWEVEGFISKSGYVYPIDTDTKVISTVFERLSSPVFRTIAKESGYVVETANQTTYPDFTLTAPDTGHRIALDVKTTYVSSRMSMTLGSYNSFIRNDTKNILHPYSTYSEHWIAGFIYSQNDAFEEYDLDNMPKHGEIPCPYTIEAIFIRNKHEVTGLRAGSGNTKNIGSVYTKSAIEFASVLGPFTGFNRARDACDHYWRGYEDYVLQIRTADDILSHPDFLQFGPTILAQELLR